MQDVTIQYSSLSGLLTIFGRNHLDHPVPHYLRPRHPTSVTSFCFTSRSDPLSHPAFCKVQQIEEVFHCLETVMGKMGVKRGLSMTWNGKSFAQPLDFVVRPAGIEPATLSLEG